MPFVLFIKPVTGSNIVIGDQTRYRWRNSYSGMNVDQAKRLKELEDESARLKRAVADL